MKRTIFVCDRPGCGYETEHPLKAVSDVSMRVGPMADLQECRFEFCDQCYNELKYARLETDYDFMEKLLLKKETK